MASGIPQTSFLANQSQSNVVVTTEWNAEGGRIERIKALTGGAGVDRIVEVDVAGNAKDYQQILARDGLVAAYGSNTPGIALTFSPMILTGVAIRFFIVYEVADAARAEAVADLTHRISEGRLQHAVAASYPLGRIVDAHEAVEKGAHMGNVVLTP